MSVANPPYLYTVRSLPSLYSPLFLSNSVYWRSERRTRNWMRDFHYKTSRWIAANFENFCWPTFGSSDLMQGQLQPGVKRRLQMIAFYQWVVRFLEVCDVIFGGCELHRGSERYSSKTCGWCNRIKENLGGSRTFKCPFEDCYFHYVTVHRDAGGAQNIDMLAYLDGEFPYPSHEVWSRAEYHRFVDDSTTANRDGTSSRRA